MIKLIERLEKSKAFWYLLFAFVLFFLLRLPSVIEPNWYGDEGIYQVLGNAINNGKILYSEAWDNKPPLLYVTYALFSSDHFTVRLVSLLSGILATFFFFFLSQKLFNQIRISIITTTLFILLFATPYIEGNIANAENFMLMPVIAAGLLLYSIAKKQPHTKLSFLSTHFSYLFAGLLLGMAFLFKIVAFFDFAAFSLFLIIVCLPKKIAASSLKKFPVYNFVFLVAGFVLPLLLTAVYFLFKNAFNEFISATFFGNISYVGLENTFFIPQGFLLVKLLLLAIATFLLIYKRNTFSQSAIFILLWISFGLFNAFFSGRPYTHYMLVLLPSFCLLVGLCFATATKKIRVSILAFLIIILSLLFSNFIFYPLEKTLQYYQNAFLFVTNQKDLASYQSFFDPRTPRDYQIASFIKKNTTDADTIFIWGDSAQIYTLANKLPPSKYTVAYHITQNQEAIDDMQQQLNMIKPKYIIALPETPALPFSLTLYNTPFIISEVTIYEQNL